MTKIIEFVLKNKLAIWIMTLIVLLFGIYSGSKMKLESLPNLEIPYVVVTTAYPGGTAEQIDEEVSSKLTRIINNIENVKKVNSTSYMNFSMVTAEFDYGIDMSKVKTEIETEISKLELPEGAQESEILEISMSSIPVLVMDISGKDLTNSEISKLIEGNLLPEINKIEGIGNASISGAVYKEAVITYNEKAMSKYGIDRETLDNIIKANNTNIPLGLIEFKESEESVLINSEYRIIKDLLMMSLPFKNELGNNLLLKELVSIEMLEVNEGISRTNGNAGISLAITKSNSANTVEVVDSVKAKIDEFKENHKGLEVVYVLDQGQPVKDSVFTMLEKALLGAVIAIVIILIFLRDWKSTIIAVVSIPLSLLIAMALLKQLDISLNLMTLAAMTVAIGRVIDDSIVVVENIYRRLVDKEEKLYGRELIKESTMQMFIPIMSSTLVTIAVFLPMMFVGGMVGELFMPFALTMSFSLLASLLVAITVVPVMAHTLFKKALYGDKGKLKNHKESKSRVYQRVLEWSLNHKLIVILLSFALVVGSGLLLPKVGFSFMPEEKTNTATFSYEAVNGELEKTLKSNLNEAEDYLLNKNDDVKTVKVELNNGNGNPMAAGKTNISVSVTYHDLVKDYTKANENIIKELSELGHKGEWKQSVSGPSMSMGSSGLEYLIYGNELSDLETVVSELENHLKENDDLTEVKSELSNVYKENVLTIKKEELSKYGLTTAQVGMALYNFSIDKDLTTVIDEDGNSLTVVEKGKKISYDNLTEMLEKELMNINGFSVKVKDVVTVSEGTTLGEVKKENGRWVASVGANLKEGVKVSEVSVDIDKYIDKMELPLGVTIETGGVTAQMIESFVQLGLAMLAAIAIVYLILVLTFKEGLAPFVILMSLPVSIIGVVLILLFTNNPLDISGMLGLLMLIGIVVTNAIVMVDRILENEYAGKDLREAIVEACLVRLRPILMTAIATVGTLLPLVFGTTVGLIGKGLALTVIGGLISSTLLTLIVVPVVYELMSKLFRKNRKNIRWD